MMILAADTTTQSASVALLKDGAILGETTLSLGRAHSTTFLPALEELMRRCGTTHQDVSAYACSVGPGSYTGIRIGLAALQMMAFASGHPVYGVSTLDALAFPLRLSPHIVVCPMIDARRGRIFASAIDGLDPFLSVSEGRGRWVREGNYTLEAFAIALLEALRSHGRTTAVLCGDAAPLHVERLRTLLPGIDVRTARGALLSPLASSVALLAERLALSGMEGDPSRLAASYLSPSQAERESLEKADPS